MKPRLSKNIVSRLVKKVSAASRARNQYDTFGFHTLILYPYSLLSVACLNKSRLPLPLPFDRVFNNSIAICKHS
jgi:hypothetical protein